MENKFIVARFDTEQNGSSIAGGIVYPRCYERKDTKGPQRSYICRTIFQRLTVYRIIYIYGFISLLDSFFAHP